jgi:23S rRNA pseudouridine1911/1915/1917 synthase
VTGATLPPEGAWRYLAPSGGGRAGRPPGTETGETIVLRVPEDAAGSRLDRHLADALAGHTRSALRRLILEGRVTVNGMPASKSGVALEEGMTIAVRLPPPRDDRPRAEAIPLDVVHEDDALLVVDKPAGLVVHPGHGRRDGTLVNALLGRGTRLSPRGAPDRPGIVHRLDRETSGLLVVAKTEAAHAALSDAFSRRAIRKRYEALVWGHPEPAEGVIEKRIGRSRSNPVKMTIRGRGSREALTRYVVRERLPGFALLTLHPETGRTHQIRVHLQSIHHSIVGDARYGGRMWKGVQDAGKRKVLRDFDRLALHASQIAFEHPGTGCEVTFSAPLPESFETLLEVLRRG